MTIHQKVFWNAVATALALAGIVLILLGLFG